MEEARGRVLRGRFQYCIPSKYLKGQLGPSISDVTFSGSKEVSFAPPHESIFAPKEVSLGPVLVTSRFLHQRRSVGSSCW